MVVLIRLCVLNGKKTGGASAPNSVPGADAEDPDKPVVPKTSVGWSSVVAGASISGPTQKHDKNRGFCGFFGATFSGVVQSFGFENCAGPKLFL